MAACVGGGLSDTTIDERGAEMHPLFWEISELGTRSFRPPIANFGANNDFQGDRISFLARSHIPLCGLQAVNTMSSTSPRDVQFSQ